MSRNKSNAGMVLRQKGSSVLAAILCILIGLAVGLIALFIINPEHAWDQGFMRIIQGGFYDFPYGVGRTLTNSAPLIMTGLSVAFAFKTGLFNITSIMFNWIGLYMVNEIVYARGTGAMYDVKSTRTWKLVDTSPESVIPSAGMSELFHTPSTTIAIFLAIAAAVLIWVILEKTTFGYELKAVGLNKNAARYAGINEKKNIILSMTIAGALAGFGAGLLYLSGGAEWNPLNTTTLPAMGFNGIATALLAASHPIGTIFSSVFISHITVGGSFLPTRYFPPEIADLISGIIIYLCAFAMLFRGVIGRMLHADKDISDANAEPAPQAGKEAK